MHRYLTKHNLVIDTAGLALTEVCSLLPFNISYIELKRKHESKLKQFKKNGKRTLDVSNVCEHERHERSRVYCLVSISVSELNLQDLAVLIFGTTELRAVKLKFFCYSARGK